MTQRIFDVENEKDMADLWNILPDRVFKIHTSEEHIYYSDGDETQYFAVSGLIAINWHDKTEITRPIQEATEDDIGKICCFWNDDTDYSVFGFLTKVTPHIIEANKSIYQFMNEKDYKHCRRLTKQEIEELC